MNELEIIMLKFANRVLDVRDGKENPTLGEMIDEPVKAIQDLMNNDAKQQAFERHIDIIEEQLFDAQVQLKKLREELGELNDN